MEFFSAVQRSRNRRTNSRKDVLLLIDLQEDSFPPSEDGGRHSSVPWSQMTENLKKKFEKILKIFENFLKNFWKNFEKFLKNFWNFFEIFFSGFLLLGQETLDMRVFIYLMGSPNCKNLKKYMWEGYFQGTWNTPSFGGFGWPLKRLKWQKPLRMG